MFRMYFPGHVVESMHVLVERIHKEQALGMRVPHRTLRVCEQRRTARVLLRRHLVNEKTEEAFVASRNGVELQGQRSFLTSPKTEKFAKLTANFRYLESHYKQWGTIGNLSILIFHSRLLSLL